MKSNFKRALSLVLAVLMVFTAVPLSGFAVGEWDCNVDGHEFYGELITREGKHARWCSKCDLAFGYMVEDVPYEGFQDCYSSEEVTCKNRATCDYCNREFGELSDEHTGTASIGFDEKFVANAATCQSAAYYWYKCSDCGEPMYDRDAVQVGSPDPNAHKYTTAISNGNGTHNAKCEYCENVLENIACSGGTATCTQKAVCAYCNTEYGNLKDHDFTKKVTDEAHKKSEATCTRKAVYFYNCANCDAISTTDTYEDGEMKAHDFTAKIAEDKYLATAGTCQAEATYYTSCKDCTLSSKGTASEATFEGTKSGHTWGTYTYNNDAKCGVDGTKTASCQIVGCTATDTITAEGTALTHSFTKETAAEDKANLRKEATCTAKATYWKYCANEGCTACARDDESAKDAYFEYGEVASHVYTREVEDEKYNRTDATCLAKATRWYVCATCDKSAKDVEGVEKAYYEYGEKKAHDYSQEAKDDKYIAKKADCTTDAIYWYVCSQEGCFACAKDDESASDKYYTDVGSATGHDIEDFEGKEPTCTEDGYSDYKQCKICQTYTKAQETRKATGHKEYVSKEAQAATCSYAGWTEEKKCAYCEKTMVESLPVPALSHVDSDADGICDREGCGTIIDADDAKCSCICHQSGIIGVIAYIVILIWKLLGVNKYCDCGIEHY